MAKFKGKGVVVAGLIAGAASILSKKENRDKAMEIFNQTKEKVNSNEKIQELMNKIPNANSKTSTLTDNEPVVEETLKDVASTAGRADDMTIDGNQMLDEGGGQTTIDAYNEKQHTKYHE